MEPRKRGSGSKERVGRKPSLEEMTVYKFRLKKSDLLTYKSVYGKKLAKRIIELLDNDIKNKTLFY